MKIRPAAFPILVALVSTFAIGSRAQVTTGTPPFGSFSGGPDIIDNANLNVHYTIPVLQKAGRGQNFAYDLAYDSSVWQPVYSGSTKVWEPVGGWGWSAGVNAGGQQYIVYNEGVSVNVLCKNTEEYKEWTFTNFVYYDIVGTPHYFNASATYVAITGGEWVSGCPAPGASYSPGQTVSVDGFAMTYSVGGGPVSLISLQYRNGSQYVVPIGVAPPGSSGNTSITDRNGNVISSSNGTYTDTLGDTALTVTNGASTTLAYTAPSGATANYTISYTTQTVRTNFGCSGISEFGPTSESLVNKVTLPDGSYYEFTYEATPGYSGDVTGRIASVQLPTGGTISYTYTGGSNGVVCADGSTATLERSTPDTGSSHWTYAHSESGTAWTTTITDPQNNQSTLNFQGIYETERQVYQGTASGTPLKTVYTCYNGGTINCNLTSIVLPISKLSVIVSLPNGSSSVESQTVTSYNSSGLVTEVDEYGYGAAAPGALARKTLTSYASLGNGIVDQPASVTIQDGSGNTAAETSYTYDAGSLQATSGTPQHVSISGSRGNATTIQYLVSGSTYLSKTFTYYDTGNADVATDVNGGATTYNYSSESATCGNAFPNSISEAISPLSQSFTWNCTGAVDLTAEDENSHTVTTNYTNAYFWRPDSAQDQMSPPNTTNLHYTEQTSAESSLVFSNSTTDVLATFDGLGRPYLSQKKQSPSGNYDSVETEYDPLGRPTTATLPYSASGGTSCSGTCPGTITTYDPLGRPTSVTDSGGLDTTYSYNANDVLETVGPAPSGENTKRKQYEYDALGRLISVCEITSASGSGSCGQNTPATGFFTQYTYDALGDPTGVAQGGGAQTRTYNYDGLGRMTSETNPESGTTTYYYDSVTSGNCSFSSGGDLLLKVDAAGNGTCYVYDKLHRLASIGQAYNGSPNASVTPDRCFTYDAATVDAVAMANAKGRLAEAYTVSQGTGCSATKITDEGFSYDARGEETDLYESTPHSAGYYHSTMTYWANGVLNQLSASTGYYLSYGVDGEGRISSSTDGGGGKALTSTTYNPASQPTQLSFGYSGDTDSYTYDPNSGRMTQYTFNVGSQSLVGNLKWNANGSLAQLAITDPFNSANQQTCNYTHDDLARIAGANCGSAFSGTYSYDAFGNLAKTGTDTFQATYNSATNQMTSIGGQTPGYDANGEVTNDFLNSYSWDALGRPVMVDGVGITYDALGRMAEESTSGTYTESLYSPTGFKMEIMNGQSNVAALGPFPGGAVGVFSSVFHYRHADWQGSSRFASTSSHTVYYDGAYGPFGEPYAGSGTTDLNFTGMDQDTASNVYDFPAREYGIQGRWPSPDPAGLAAVNPMDPQTWNRYAYVRNSPLESTDPTGMFAGPHGCLARVRRQDKGGCDYGSIDEDGGGDDGEEFDQEVLLGNGGPGFGDLYGNTIFDAIQGAPGTFVTWTPGQIGFGFGFSISLWRSTWNFIDSLTSSKFTQFDTNEPNGYGGTTITVCPPDQTCYDDQPPSLSDISPAFFVVFVDYIGTQTEINGFIPNLLADEQQYYNDVTSEQAAEASCHAIGCINANAQHWNPYLQYDNTVTCTLFNTLFVELGGSPSECEP